VKKFQAKYGPKRVTDDPIAGAYAQVYLWKLAVEKAKSSRSMTFARRFPDRRNRV